MTKERWQRVKALFHAANERPPDARAAFLAAETGDDASLRGEVESMLAMDTDDASVLDGFSFRPAALSVDALMSGGSVQPAARPVLSAGHRIGSYEIVELLGAGAMGEVYRTRDTKLNREVALKVIPPSLAMNPDRLARFRREAQLLAALNHPNIAAIYGVEDAADHPALVLELIEGPTLAARIADGTLPLTEALRIARQIAEGLEAAHEQGIIHRDLKPSNIHVRTDGLVKILDFGLAKSLAAEGVMTPEEGGAPAPHEPTATREGIILGTAGYMSPEQARGQAVDKRGDIWAFGCVLFEMLAGRPAFGGETMTDVLAAVVTAEPEWSALPADLPPRVHTLLRRCLNKDSRNRLQAIGDARIELDEITSAGELCRPRQLARHGVGEGGPGRRQGTSGVARRRRRARRYGRRSRRQRHLHVSSARPHLSVQSFRCPRMSSTFAAARPRTAWASRPTGLVSPLPPPRPKARPSSCGCGRSTRWRLCHSPGRRWPAGSSVRSGLPTAGSSPGSCVA